MSAATTTKAQPRRSELADELLLGRPTGRRAAVDTLMRILVWLAAGLALAPLLWILVTVAVKGAPLTVASPPDWTQICVDTTSQTRATTSACGDFGGEPPQGYQWYWTPGGRYAAVGTEFNPYGSRTTMPTGDDIVIMAAEKDSGGWILLPSLQWWTEPLGSSVDFSPRGGALQAIYGSVVITLMCTVIAVPLAMLAAVFLVEYARGSRIGRAVSFCVDILTGIPSIVAALFIYALFVTILGGQRSAFATALALAMLMLPTVLRSTEEMLKLVPDSLREASYALGVPRWKTILSVVLPTARTGIITGIILGIARVMGETAPLLILVGYATNLYFDPLNGSMGSLPTMINAHRTTAPQFAGYDRVWGAAFTLILIVMLLNLLARGIARVSTLKEK